jgi:hypothetical protein
MKSPLSKLQRKAKKITAAQRAFGIISYGNFGQFEPAIRSNLCKIAHKNQKTGKK